MILEQHQKYLKGVKSVIRVKLNSPDIPKILTVNDSVIANPVETANIFNNSFSFIASETKVNIKYFHKDFSNFLKNSLNIIVLDSLHMIGWSFSYLTENSLFQ